jgi:hemerythrin
MEKDEISIANDDKIVSWEDAYSTGIELIDNQHKELISHTNMLYQACLSGENIAKPLFKETLSGMVEYVRFHFTAELELLNRVKYPDYQDHKSQHDLLIKKIIAASNDYQAGTKFIATGFVRTLKNWIFGHIAVSDKNYAAYVADQKTKGLLSDKDILGR